MRLNWVNLKEILILPVNAGWFSVSLQI